MSARSRDARRFDPLADVFAQAWIGMGNPTPAERIRRSARMMLADMPAERKAELADMPGKRSCA